MSIPENLRYSSTHEWVRDDGDHIVTVGVTDYAQDKMTELVYVELPDVDREVQAGEELAVVESVKSASDIYAPVGGVITEVNAALEDDPTLVNSAPYGDGWLFRLRISDEAAMNEMLGAAAYAKLISE